MERRCGHRRIQRLVYRIGWGLAVGDGLLFSHGVILCQPVHFRKLGVGVNGYAFRTDCHENMLVILLSDLILRLKTKYLRYRKFHGVARPSLRGDSGRGAWRSA